MTTQGVLGTLGSLIGRIAALELKADPEEAKLLRGWFAEGGWESLGKNLVAYLDVQSTKAEVTAPMEETVRVKLITEKLNRVKELELEVTSTTTVDDAKRQIAEKYMKDVPITEMVLSHHRIKWVSLLASSYREYRAIREEKNTYEELKGDTLLVTALKQGPIYFDFERRLLNLAPSGYASTSYLVSADTTVMELKYAMWRKYNKIPSHQHIEKEKRYTSDPTIELQDAEYFYLPWLAEGRPSFKVWFN
ncbi:Hypothetical protein POVN_LOCUS614 [uncultured virus]|nr:Hypothetical protein POVN_LOCUS614 [uncultured virus]